MHPEIIFNHIRWLCGTDARASIFYIMKEINDMLSRGDLESCRVLLGRMEAKLEDKTSPGDSFLDACGAMLAITYAAKERLGLARSQFMLTCIEKFLYRYGRDKTVRLLGHLQ